jgi:hypothetical protein
MGGVQLPSLCFQGLAYPRQAPALGLPLHSLCSLRSRTAALSSEGLPWCFTLVDLGDLAVVLGALCVLANAVVGLPRGMVSISIEQKIQIRE